MLHSTELFAHLQQYRPVSVEAVLRGSRDGSSVHPAVLALGLRYGDGSITGSTARCVALVHALCQVSVVSSRVIDCHLVAGGSGSCCVGVPAPFTIMQIGDQQARIDLGSCPRGLAKGFGQ